MEWAWPAQPLIWTLVASTVLVAWFLGAGHWKSVKKYNLPPGPPTLPFIGNMHQLMNSKKLPHHVTVELAKTYGPIMLMKMGVRNYVFVSSPEMAMEVMRTQDQVLANRPGKHNMSMMKYLSYANYHLPSSQLGDYHSFYRKLIITQLLSQKKLKDFEAQRREEQDLMIHEAFEACTSNADASSSRPINLRSLITTLTINVITQMAFGQKFFGSSRGRGRRAQSEEEPAYVNQWKFFITENTELFGSLLMEDCLPALKWVDVLTGLRPRMQSCFQLMDSLLQKLLDENKERLYALSPKELETFEPNHFMDLVLLLGKRDHVIHINDLSIKAIAADLIIAGSDTNAVILEWALVELLRNPKLLKKAQEEVDSVVGKGRCVQESDAAQLPYLAAVIKETFRLHPPVPWLVPRSNLVDCKVGGYDIPAHSIISIQVYGISRNASLWEDPLKFDPTRFLTGKNLDVDVKGTYPQLLPFGSGRRICPGIGLSNALELPTLARIIHSFDLSLPSGVSSRNLDMSETFGVVLKRKEPLNVVMSPRLPLHLYNI